MEGTNKSISVDEDSHSFKIVSTDTLPTNLIDNSWFIAMSLVSSFNKDISIIAMNSSVLNLANISSHVLEASDVKPIAPNRSLSITGDVRSLFISLSNTADSPFPGSITPMIHYDSVEFYGTIHPKSTGHSYKRFKELNLAVGDIICAEYVIYVP